MKADDLCGFSQGIFDSGRGIGQQLLIQNAQFLSLDHLCEDQAIDLQHVRADSGVLGHLA